MPSDEGKKDFSKLRSAVALGGLLHDIGKLLQRAEAEEKGYFEAKSSEEHKTAHEEKGKEFFKNFLERAEILKREKVTFLGKEITLEQILEAFIHHNDPSKLKDKELQKLSLICQLANYISATERIPVEDTTDKELFERLYPVFQIISIGESNRKKEVYFYPLKPLKVCYKANAKKETDSTTPKETNTERITDCNKETDFTTLKKILFPKKSGENYDLKKLLEEFGEALNKDFLIKEQNFDKFLSKIYHILYKYLWCIPSSICDNESEIRYYTDISLFDHSRGVAAIASSLITDYNLKLIEKEEKNLKENLKLVLIEGDISGIQKFLFGIRNYEGVAKRLRGRSFFLAVLPDLIARYILKELGYPHIVNILYSGGGKFQLLIGYEEGIEKRLEDLQKHVEEVLLKEFGGRLGFVLGYKVFPLKDFENYSKVVKELHDELNKKKKRKFLHVLEEFEKIANERFEELIQKENKIQEEEENPQKKGTKICPSCHWEVIEEKKDTCDWCERFKNVGGKLPKVRYLAFDLNKEPPAGNYAFPLKGLGTVEILEEPDIIYKDRWEILKLNDTQIEEEFVVSGFRFICLAVPSLKGDIKENEKLLEVIKSHYSEDWNLEGKEKPEGGDIIPFTLLEELSIGDSKLGYFKADVDNLGLVFMVGLGEEHYTFSRIATLSRSLDLFFSLYMDRFLRELPEEVQKDYEKYVDSSTNQLLNHLESPVYTVYSGGDDLFLIAPWNVAIDFSYRIREEFGEYTCQNPDLGISAGLGIFKGSYPIRLAADKTDSLESKAKERVEGDFKKDKIAVFGSVLKWNQLKEKLENLKPLKEALIEGKLSRSLIYRFYLRLKAIREIPDGVERKEELLRFIPYFYYQLARNVKDQKLREELENLFIQKSSEEIIDLDGVLFALHYLLMFTRKRKS